jgi:hypothetical protein
MQTCVVRSRQSIALKPLIAIANNFKIKWNDATNKAKDVMIRKLDCSVYYNNRTEKLLKWEPKKMQKSDENLRRLHSDFFWYHL